MGCGQSADAHVYDQRAHANQKAAYDINEGEVPAGYAKPAYEHHVRSMPEPTTTGSYKDCYTIKEISIHNSSLGFCEIFPWKGAVHSSDKFKESVRPDVEEFQKTRTYDEWDQPLDFNVQWTENPVFLVISKGYKYKKFSQMIGQSKVAQLSIISNKQYFQDIFEDAKGIESSLNSDGKRTPYQTEYLDVLSRFFACFSELSGDIPFNLPPPSGDPNKSAFVLSKSIDPSSIRLWIVEWQTFDTDLPDDNEWHCPWSVIKTADQPVIDTPLTDEEVFRSDIGEDTLDYQIDGEAAWDVIQVDLIKDDVTTPGQEEVLLSRSKRFDLGDPERMKRRRVRIAQYFIKERADGLETYCDKYLGFADTLEEDWKKFLSLCE